MADAYDFDDINFDDIVLDEFDPLGDQSKKPDNNSNTYDPLATSARKKDSRTVEKQAKNKRAPYKKLDADLILSSKGLPRLRREAPNLRFRGKGYEEQDLQKLMEYYHMWAHGLYPRVPFPDFARLATKACASKRCKVTLATWQQEFRDKNNPIMSAELSGMTLEDEDITAPHESSSIDPFAESPRSPSPIHTTIPQPSFSSQPVEENPSDDEQPLFTATPEPSTAQDARARAAASRAAALEKLAARRRQKEEQQRQIHTQHEDEDMFEDDPGAEYLDDM